MRSSILDLHEKRDLEKMNQLLNDADVFFSNRRPGYQERFGLTADELCSKHPGLIHAKVVLHGETGPWSNRTGFDEVTLQSLGSKEGQQVSVDLILKRGCEAVRCARIVDFLRALDESG